MNTAATTPTVPQPLLGVTDRVAIALAVLAFVVGACWYAGQASHESVQTATLVLNRTYVTLPPVNIVTRRETHAPAPVAAHAMGRTSSL